MITNDIKERLNSFFIVKSLVSNDEFRIKYSNDINVQKNDKNYLMIYEVDDNKYRLKILDDSCMTFLVNRKFNVPVIPFQGSSLDFILRVIEKYLIDEQ